MSPVDLPLPRSMPGSGWSCDALVGVALRLGLCAARGGQALIGLAAMMLLVNAFATSEYRNYAAELLALPDVDGALVGGASLDPEGFAAIVDAAAGG
jgi:hypothetical protein